MSLRRILMVLILALPLVCMADEAAGAGDGGEEIGVERLRQRYWALCDTEGPLIQNPLYAERWRPEFSLLVGTHIADPFVSSYLYGISLGYHLNETLSLHALGWNAVSRATGGTPRANTNLPRYFLGLEARANLLYAELSLAGKHLLHFDTYVSAGVGELTTNIGSNLTGTLGIGQAFHLTHDVALHLDYKLLAYQENLVEMNPGQAVAVGQAAGSRFNLNNLITIGISFLLDPVQEEKETCRPPDFEPPPLVFPSLPASPKLAPSETEENVETVAGPELSFFDATGGTQMTSDGIGDRSLQITYRNHRRDPFWEYPEEAESGWDFGLGTELHEGENPSASYSGFEATATVGRKFSRAFQTNLTLGGNQLQDHASGQSKSILAGAIDTSATIAEAIELNLIAKNDFIYADLIQPGGITELLTAQTVYLNANYSAEGVPWRVITRSSVGYFSDSNWRRETDISLLYGLSIGEPWIWAGLGANYLSYSATESTYWSPTRFLALGPRFESDFRLVGKLSFALGANLNVYQEEELPWEFGYYLSARLRYGLREATYADLSYIRIQSAHDGGSWYQDSIFLNLGVAF